MEANAPCIAVLGLLSAENDAELGDGMAGVTPCWKL
jgi:hypothetical protein